jgi:hypothetical protein
MVEAAQEHALDGEFDQEDRVFHYTTSAGLCGIIETNCLWASHWQVLNDNSELVHAKSMLEARLSASLKADLSRLNRHSNGQENERVAEKTSKLRVNDLYTGLLENWQAFVLSGFSCRPSENEAVNEFSDGALPHWAFYGQKGGFALRINPRILWDAMNAEFADYRDVTIGLYKIDYTTGPNPPEPQLEAYKTIEEYYSGALNAGLSGKHYDRDVVPVISQFFRIVSFSKNPFFKWEREARLAVLRPGPTDSPIDGSCPAVSLRTSGDRVVPYIKLLAGKLFTTPGLIERIIVGPGEDRERQRAVLETYLRMKGYTTSVGVSKIPLILK